MQKDIVVEHPAPPLNMGNTGLTSSQPFGLDSDDLCQHNNPKLTCMQCHSFVNLSKLGDYDADSLAQVFALSRLCLSVLAQYMCSRTACVPNRYMHEG